MIWAFISLIDQIASESISGPLSSALFNCPHTFSTFCFAPSCGKIPAFIESYAPFGSHRQHDQHVFVVLESCDPQESLPHLCLCLRVMALSKPLPTVGSFLQLCEKGRFDVAQQSISCGLDPRVTDQYGWSAVHWACWYGDVSFTRKLIQEFNCTGKERTTRGVDRDGRWFPAGTTPLHIASR